MPGPAAPGSDQLSALVAGMSHDEKMKLAGYRGTDPEILLLLAGIEDAQVWKALAGNSSSTEDVHLRLLTRADWPVRCDVASTSVLSARVVKVLAKDENENVRYWLTMNKAVELNTSFPVACLEESARGLVFLEEAAERARVDADTFAVLRPGWTGTLEELIEACGELASESA